MRTYVVNELDCGDDPNAYRAWLEANAPADIRIEWHERTGGGGGLYDEAGDLVDRNTYDDPWDAYCNGRPWTMETSESDESKRDREMDEYQDVLDRCTGEQIPDYCTQNGGDCETCSLVNYGRDCQNNPV